MKRAAGQMQVPFSLAMAEVRTLNKKERLVDYTYAYVWLFHVMALSASLYGCQVWSTSFLHPSTAERTVLSCSQASLFKMVLGLPYTTSTRCVLRDCAQMPLQFYWARCVLRFWNACFNSRNPLVYHGLRAEWHLAVQCQHAWVGLPSCSNT